MIAGGAWAGVGCVCAGGFGSQTLSENERTTNVLAGGVALESELVESVC